jgi:hypothetical protein
MTQFKCPSGACDISDIVARKWAGVVMGSIKKPSEKLKMASRENGKKGGRPKKKID